LPAGANLPAMTWQDLAFGIHLSSTVNEDTGNVEQRRIYSIHGL
jgi:hypothetical protein